MAILYGTQSNGETLPVLVDQFGNLLAKGIEGPPGPEGPPGVGELPPGATDGALLGWENGELVWVTEPPPVYVPGFRPVIYTGNGGTQSITGVGFIPDLVWCKSRNSDISHGLIDTIRGGNKILYPNLTSSEYQDANIITSFDLDGFTLGSYENVNNSGENFVAWCWDAGDTTETNSDGTIESQVRSSGNFSVVTFNSGANGSVGHGLSKKPSLVIMKNLDQDIDWRVWHESFPDPQRDELYLNQDRAISTSPEDVWGDSGYPSDSLLWFKYKSTAGGGPRNIAAYCWAETPGASSFGKYVGKGSRQTIATGFRPSLVIIKSTGTGNWFMFDNARGDSYALYANLSDKGADTGVIEFLDTGFQLLFALPGVNQSNETYIYAAFANPSDAAFAQRQLRRQARQEERQQNETQPR